MRRTGESLNVAGVVNLDPLAFASRVSVRMRYALATIVVATATGVGFFWTSMPDPRNLSLVFFGAILLVGLWLGTRPALFSALLSFLTYNFFLVEPRFTLHFAPADLLAFASFLVGALIVGGLSGRLSDRARDATNRLRDLTALFEASRDLSRVLQARDVAERVTKHLEHGGCSAAIWLREGDSLTLAAASAGRAAGAQQASERVQGLLDSSWIDDIGDEEWLLRLETGERQLGGVAIWPPPGAHAIKPDRRWIAAMLELGAVAIDRARLIAEVTEASVVAEKEGLRTALLSSLSHDLRTPIATILASVTALQEHEGQFDAVTRSEMLETIQEESNRLNRYVANLLDMTRLESGALQVKSVLMEASEAMVSALERISGRLKERRMLRVFEAQTQRILVDPVLIEQALVNVLENAIAYSPPNSTILVSIRPEGPRLVLSVEDEGPGIPPGDLERVFDKFFRGRSDRRRGAGVGLGLSVARGLVEAFGGDVRAVSPAAGYRGARVEIRLPAYPALEAVE
jgi:two-component system sensor histidine kinase KdpD